MKINKDELKQIWEMQKELDKRIHDEMGLDESKTIEKRKIALIVELGEMLQEMPSVFKYWKRGAVDNREKALDEYVDVLHFALSICDNSTITYIFELLDDLNENLLIESIGWLLYELSDVFRANDDYVLFNVLEFGASFGFTWSEIYQCYLFKNEINHERQDNNY